MQKKMLDSKLQCDHSACSRILEEIANDDELKTLTEEDIKTILGGQNIAQCYGNIRDLQQ